MPRKTLFNALDLTVNQKEEAMPKIPNPYYKEELQVALEKLEAKSGFQVLKKEVKKFVEEEWLKAFPLSEDSPSEQWILQAAAKNYGITTKRLLANSFCDSLIENFFQESIRKLIKKIKEKFKLADVEAWAIYLD